jgi:hypothetical protein
MVPVDTQHKRLNRRSKTFLIGTQKRDIVLVVVKSRVASRVTSTSAPQIRDAPG